MAGRLLTANLEGLRQRERNGPDSIRKKAGRPSARLDEPNREVRTRTPDDDSREACAAADIGNQASLWQLGHHREGIDDVLADQQTAIAIADETEPAIPDSEELDESGEAREGGRFDGGADQGGALNQLPLLL